MQTATSVTTDITQTISRLVAPLLYCLGSTDKQISGATLQCMLYKAAFSFYMVRYVYPHK